MPGNGPVIQLIGAWQFMQAWNDLSDDSKSTMWSGLILGIGLMGAVDSIIFHQLLQWHNFYYDTTDFWRVFSDGLLQAFTAGTLFIGSLRLWSQRGKISKVMSGQPLWTGVLFGAGAFQLFDGTVNHKVLRLHQVREGAGHNLPYDLAWIGFALVLLALGWMLLQRSREHAGEPHRERADAA